MAASSTKKIVVGVLGGGQLGRMMGIAAHNMGDVVVVPLDPGGGASPAGQVCNGDGFGLAGRPTFVAGSFKDAAKIRELAAACDVLTVEIEHVNCDVLDELVAEGKPVRPSPGVIRIIQDKLVQKQHFAAHGVDLGQFVGVPDAAALPAVGEALGYPYMLKARKGAYDGKGNAVVVSAEDAEAAFASLGGDDASFGGCYAERWCPYVKELAVMVVRTVEGTCMAYPVVEFTARNNVCHTTFCPARVSPAQRALAQKVASQAVACLPEGAVGVFGVEMFALDDGRIMLNEIAPRPHNSGHYTIEACHCSQFEAHLRAVAGGRVPPPGDVSHRVGASIMVNILGRNGSMEETMEEFRRLAAVPGSGPHWYGKTAARVGRKMGHVTVCGSDESDLARRLAGVRDLVGEDGMPGGGSKNGAVVEVGVIMGSDSDLPCMRAATDILDEFGVPYEVTIVSAHRTPERMFDYAKTAFDRGLKVIIAGAGGAAHLPGMVAAMTPLPVVGVPVKTSALSGVDSLYSIVQMPRGVPVATVAIGNAKNAGLLAVRMIAGCTGNMRLVGKLNDFRTKGREEQEAKAEKLLQMGSDAYLKEKGGAQSKTVM
jgi:phosphoribosylaminoimidazole carboxylase